MIFLHVYTIGVLCRNLFAKSISERLMKMPWSIIDKKHVLFIVQSQTDSTISMACNHVQASTGSRTTLVLCVNVCAHMYFNEKGYIRCTVFVTLPSVSTHATDSFELPDSTYLAFHYRKCDFLCCLRNPDEVYLRAMKFHLRHLYYLL